MRKPALVLSTDGVGTKVLVALEVGRFDTVGEDLVNHSVNDILVHAARPIAFMDYIAGSALTVEQIAGIVEGIARACRAHGMALAGGETAQMPGLYQPGHYDLAGTIIGVVEEDEHCTETGSARRCPARVRVHRAHTNGYTLARIIFDTCFLPRPAQVGQTVADALLARTRAISRRWPRYSRGTAWPITGGGIPNLVWILPPGCEAVVHQRSWTFPFVTLCRTPEKCRHRDAGCVQLGVGLIAVLPLPMAAAGARRRTTESRRGFWARFARVGVTIID
jgi:phosphoribosylformylglycinamidine cyclo-ligase